MSSTTAILQWSERKPPVEIVTGEELDEFLDRIAATSQSDFPFTVRLQVHGFNADILLGLSESFVYLDEPAQRRYLITVGDTNALGVVNFHSLGQDTTEFFRRHLIPGETAREVLREFFHTGCLSTNVAWEEDYY